MLTVDLGGGTAPITVRQHSVAPPEVDTKVRLTVNGPAVVMADETSPGISEIDGAR